MSDKELTISFILHRSDFIADNNAPTVSSPLSASGSLSSVHRSGSSNALGESQERFESYGVAFITVIVEKRRASCRCQLSWEKCGVCWQMPSGATSCANSIEVDVNLSNLGAKLSTASVNAFSFSIFFFALFFFFAVSQSDEWWWAWSVSTGCQCRMSGTLLPTAKQNVCFLVIKMITSRAYLLLTPATPGYST